MKISVGLPATVPGARGSDILEWARQADGGPFESLGIIDRIAYGNHEPLITLAAAAGATRRIRLMTTILSAPVRNAVLLAKEVATLDSLSGGRVVLGLGVGGRKDDYDITSSAFQDRGRTLEEQVNTMRGIWAGQGANGATLGPRPVQEGGPEVLIGAGAPAALRRAGRMGDGFISTPNLPDAIRENYNLFLQGWNEGGRRGEPRLVGAAYYALGDERAIESGRSYLRDYYGYLGEAADMIAGSMLATPDAIQGTIQAYGGIGMDELVFWPCVTELAQLQQLRDVVS
ncbi:MAG: LLM class flavin-dependent oxidoreductase [Dehalococcoidia bacterium]